MRYVLFLILCFLVVPAFPLVAAELPKICGEGVRKCAPLNKDTEKHSRCMVLICGVDDAATQTQAQEIKEAETPATNNVPDTCKNGQIKCSPLINNYTEYWGCMQDVCTDPTQANANPDCTLGQQMCGQYIRAYWICMNRICKRQNEACYEGENECGSYTTQYWGCMRDKCLGPLRFSYQDKSPFTPIAPEEPDEFRIKPKVAIPGTEDYDRKYGLVDGKRVRQSAGGGPISLKCPEGEIISCASSKMSSCICSGGSRPRNVVNESVPQSPGPNYFVIIPETRKKNP